MGDAVIVAAARTAIGTARKGTLLDVSAFDLAKWSAGEALKRSGIPGGDVDDLMMGEVAAGRRRHRPLRRDRARPHRGPGRRAQPPLRVGHGAGAGRGARSIMAGMDDVIIAGGAESLSTSPNVDEAHAAGTDELRAVDVADRTPRRPTRPRSTCRSPSVRTPPTSCGITREDWTRGRTARTCARSPRSTKVASQEEIFPIEVTLRDGTDEDLRHRRAPAPRQHAWRSSAVAEAAAPRDRGLPRSPPATRRASTTPAPRWCSSTATTPRRTASSRSPRSSRGRRSGVQPARHRPRPDLRDPEGARARRA